MRAVMMLCSVLAHVFCADVAKCNTALDLDQEFYVHKNTASMDGLFFMTRAEIDEYLTQLISDIEQTNRCLMMHEKQNGWTQETSPVASRRNVLIFHAYFLWVLRDEFRYAHPSVPFQHVCANVSEQFIP